ncbi:MAG: type VII toxin-antitoxin system MntA family adenylyltransferase antitoxin [Gammaproteobacteria bacterium]
MSPIDTIVQSILEDFPEVQGIYLFGSWGTVDERPDSDVDVALLLPPRASKTRALSDFARLQAKLSVLLHKEVDVLNLRRVSTVFQKEVVMADRRIYTRDEYAAGEFEMLTLSFYQKLNEERREILAEGLRSGSFYAL